MAEKSSDALKKLDEQLTCAVCLDHYTDPKTLPCLHSFCHQCLEGLPLDPEKGKFILTCPTCRNLTELPEQGVSGFHIAFHLNNLTEIHGLLKKVSGDKQVPCANCNKVDATGYCKECEQFLCPKCIEVHKNWAPISHHQIVRLDEVANAASQLLPMKQEVIMNCSNHAKPLEIYCETCQELICQHCTVRIHKEHNYDLVNDYYREHRHAIESSLEPLKEQIVAVTEALSTITQKEKEILQQGVVVKEEICNMIKQIIDDLIESEKKLVNHVDSAVKCKIDVLSQQKKEVEVTLRHLTDCFDFVEQSLKTGTPQQVLLGQSQMMSRMKIVSGSVKREEFVPREKADITFVRNESIVDIPQNIGKITSSFSLSSSTLVYPVTSTDVMTDAHELLPHSQNPKKHLRICKLMYLL